MGRRRTVETEETAVNHRPRRQRQTIRRRSSKNPMRTCRVPWPKPHDPSLPNAQPLHSYICVSLLRTWASSKGDFRDRYGKLPREVKLLLQCAEVRVLAANAHVDTVETREDKIMLSQRGQLFQVSGKFPRLTATKPEGKLTEIKKLLESLGK